MGLAIHAAYESRKFRYLDTSWSAYLFHSREVPEPKATSLAINFLDDTEDVKNTHFLVI